MKLPLFILSLFNKVYFLYNSLTFLHRNKFLAEQVISAARIDFQGLSLAVSNVIDHASKKFLFESEFDSYVQSCNRLGLQAPLREDLYPCLDDRTQETGFDRHYIYHPAWIARQLFKRGVKKHVDISSTLNFASIVSAFIPIDFYDIRPAKLNLSNLVCRSADLTKLKFDNDSIESLSCMHVIEHIGLGRYGDSPDPLGDVKAAAELARVLSKGGILFIVLPVGISRTQFNAHRIYSHDSVLKLFHSLSLLECALIPDGEAIDGIVYNPSEDVINAQTYGCGCYVFTK